MAEGTSLGTAYITLMLDKAGFQSQVTGLGRTLTGSLGGIVGMTAKLAGVGAGLYAVKRAIGYVNDAFLEFDQQMHNVWTLTDQTGDEIVKLSSDLRDLAWQYNITSTQAAKAMYQIYSATFYGADAMKILEASTRAAAAGLTDVFTAANMGTTVLNAYGMAAEEITRVNDLLFTSIRFGKCVTGDTRVLLADGRYKRIDELEGGAKVVSYDGRSFLPMDATWVDQGTKPTVRLETHLGREIKTTWNHPYLTDDGWKKVSELKIGDQIAIPSSLPFFGDRHVHKSRAAFLGLWLAEGTGGAYSPEITTDTYGAQVTEWAEEFGCSVSRKTTSTARCPTYLMTSGRGNSVNPAMTFLRELGLEGCRAGTKHIPEEVFSWDRESIATMLHWYFNGDGWLADSRKYESGAGFHLGFASSSKQLVKDISHLLLRFGIMGRIRRRQETNSWTWESNRYNEVRRFVDMIGIDRPMNALVPTHEPKKTRKRYGVIDYDKIVVIEAQEEERVYDLCVPHLHNFVAEDILAHNTTYGELADQFGRLAGIAAPVGASIDEMAAAIATLTRQGITTDWAVTSLRQTLMKMLQPTKDLEKAINDLGFASGGTMVRTLGFAKSLGEIKKWADQNGVALDRMFTNVRAVTAVLPLATTAAKGFALDLQRMADSAGASDVAFGKQTQSWAYQMSILKSRLNDVGISLGKVVTPAIYGFTKGVLALLKPLGGMSELLNTMGVPFLLKWAATLGTVVIGLTVLTKAFRALNVAMLASQAFMFSTLGVGGGLSGAIMKGMFTAGGGSMLAGLGIGAAGLVATSIGLKGLVELELVAGQIVGGEEVKGAMKASLMSIFGSVVGGAIFGKMFLGGLVGSGVGAAIGAGIAAAATASIFVYHIIKKAAETHEERVSVVSDTMRAWGALPYELESGPESITELRDTLSRLNPEIERTTAFFNAVQSAVEDLYKMRFDSLFEPGKWELEDKYRGVRTLADITGIAFPTEDVTRVAQMWKKSLSDANLEALAGLSDAILSNLEDETREIIIGMQDVALEELSRTEWGDFSEFIVKTMTEWAESVGAVLEQGDIIEHANMLANALFALKKVPAGDVEAAEEAAAGYLKVKESFAELMKGLDDEERIAAMFQVIPIALEASMGELVDVMGISTADLIARVLAEIEAATQPPIPSTPIPAVQEQVDRARKEFDELFASLESGDFMLGQATTMFDDLSAMAAEWTKNADIAEITGRAYAEMLQVLADYMNEMISSSVLSAIQELIKSYEEAKAAYLDSAEATLERAMAEKDLTGISEKLAGYQELLGLSAEDLTGDWKEMVDWLESVGIAINKITVLPFAKQIEVYQAALARALEAGNIAASVTALSGLSGIYNTMVASVDLLTAAGLEGSGALNVLILGLEKLYGFTRDAADGIGKLSDEINNMLGAISGAIGEMSSAVGLRSPEIASLLNVVPALLSAGDALWKVFGPDGLYEKSLEKAASAGAAARASEITNKILSAGMAMWSKMPGAGGADQIAAASAATVDVKLAADAAAESAIASTVAAIAGVATGLGAVFAIVGAVIQVFDVFAAARKRREEELAAAAEELKQNFLNLADAAITAASSLWDLAQQAESLQALQSGWMEVQGAIITALLGFLWPIAGIFELIMDSLEDSVDAIEEEAEARRASLNVPTGYKVRRAEWMAAMPGQPGDLIDDSTVRDDIEETLTWWQEIVRSFGAELDNAIAPIRNFIDRMNDLWKKLAPAIINAVIPMLNTFGWTLGEIATWMETVFAPDLEKFSAGFRRFWEEKVDPFWKEDMGPQIAVWLQRVYDWFAPVLTFMENKVWPWLVNDVWPAIKPYVESILGMLEDWARWIDANWDTIKVNLLENLTTWLGNLGESIRRAAEYILDLLGIASPWTGTTTQVPASGGVYQTPSGPGPSETMWEQVLTPGPNQGTYVVPAPTTSQSDAAIIAAHGGFGGVMGSTGQWVPYSTWNGVPVSQLARGGKLLTDGLVFGHQNEIMVPASVSPLPSSIGLNNSTEMVNHVIVTLDGRVLTKQITREKRHSEKLMTGSPNGRRWERVGA